MGRRNGSQAKGGGGACLTERDLRIVSWLDGLGGASMEQIRRRFGMGRTQGYRRVRVPQEYGPIAVQAFPLTDVKAFMGHADIQTMMVYIHHVPQRDAAERLSRLVQLRTKE